MKISPSAVARLFGATFHTSPEGDGPLLGANSPYSGCNAPDLLFLEGHFFLRNDKSMRRSVLQR